jgi:phage terminase small subunit
LRAVRSVFSDEKKLSMAELSHPHRPRCSRPDAPYDLTDEQAELWRGVVDALPGAWIEPGALPVLAAYCRQATALRRLGALMHQAEREGDYDEAMHLALIKAHSGAAQALKTLATALRLTPQSRMRADAAGAKAGDGPRGPRPWEAT